MRRLREILENVAGFFFLVQLLMIALYAITHPIKFLSEFFSTVVPLVLGIVGFFAVFSAPMYVVEQLMSDNKDENTKREVTKGCVWTLLGVVLLGLVSNINFHEKSSSSTVSNTYVREEYSRPTREYSAPKPDYRPIELPKTYKPTIAPNLERVSSPLTTEPIRYTPPTVDRITAPIPDKTSAQVPDPIAILEDEAARKEFEAKAEIVRQQWDAYYEANHEKWEAELETARKNLEANLETTRDNRIIEPAPYLHEPEPYYYPEPEPVISEPQPYEVAEKSPDEVLKDLEWELRRINSR